MTASPAMTELKPCPFCARRLTPQNVNGNPLHPNVRDGIVVMVHDTDKDSATCPLFLQTVHPTDGYPAIHPDVWNRRPAGADPEVWQPIETKTALVKFLQVEAGVRYWEDAMVNGIEDEDGSRIPCRSGDCWAPLIDLDTGKIEAWPSGTTASLHFKVCDAGVYSLLDANKNEVVKIDGYVPKIMCPGGDGYGDYIIMDVGSNGKIAKWRIDLSEFEGDTR